MVRPGAAVATRPSQPCRNFAPTVYALRHALDFTLDEATPLIGRLADIDRRIAAAHSYS